MNLSLDAASDEAFGHTQEEDGTPVTFGTSLRLRLGKCNHFQGDAWAPSQWLQLILLFDWQLDARTDHTPRRSRIWSPSGKSDVYASVRERAGDFKVSLHESGECNAGLTSQFAAQEASAVTAMGGSRHQSRWIRDTHTGSRAVIPLQFAFPASELRTWREAPVQDSGITWIDPPSGGRSIVVSCAFSEQCLLDDKWPGCESGTHLVCWKLLPSGEKFWLLWEDCPTTAREQSDT